MFIPDFNRLYTELLSIKAQFNQFDICSVQLFQAPLVSDITAQGSAGERSQRTSTGEWSQTTSASTRPGRMSPIKMQQHPLHQVLVNVNFNE